jgi:hypothetical protein
MEQNNGIQDSSANIDFVGGVDGLFNIGSGKDGDLYENNYDSLYHGQYDNLYSSNNSLLDDLTDLTSDVFNSDPPKKNKKNND